MTPEELSRLTRVALDSKEVADFELHINPSMMKPQARQKTPQQMEHIVNDFYLKNKLYFESPDDISFDPKTSTLKYKGRKRLAKKLLKDELEVEEKVAQQTVDEVSKPVKLSIPLIDLVDTDSPEFENITKEKAAEVEKELKRLAGRNVQVEVEPGRAVASVTAAPKDRLAEREKFNQKNIQKQKAKPPSFWDQKEQEEADEPTKPGTQPSEPESQMVDPQVKVRGNKIDIYNVFKKSHLLDQQKVKEIFEGDLGKYTD